MADQRLRGLERAALLGGIQERAAWLLARVRSRLVSQGALEAAAYLGHEVARLVLGGVWASFPGVPSGIAGVPDQHPDAAPLGRWARGLVDLPPVVREGDCLEAPEAPTPWGDWVADHSGCCGGSGSVPVPVPLALMVGIVVARACWISRCRTNGWGPLGAPAYHGSRRAIDAAACYALEPTEGRREAWAKAWNRAGDGWLVAPGHPVAARRLGPSWDHMAGVLTAASLALGSDAVVRAAAQRIAPALLGETTWEEVLRG